MSEAVDFIDAALLHEVSPYAVVSSEPDTDSLERYGTSVGAIRGTIRDAVKRYPNLTHDEVTALSSELWQRPVYERRVAAIVLLQGFAMHLVTNDLTRLEGFIRSAGSAALVDQLVADVLTPMLAQQDVSAAARARSVIERWRAETDTALRAAGDALIEQFG